MISVFFFFKRVLQVQISSLIRTFRRLRRPRKRPRQHPLPLNQPSCFSQGRGTDNVTDNLFPRIPGRTASFPAPRVRLESGDAHGVCSCMWNESHAHPVFRRVAAGEPKVRRSFKIITTFLVCLLPAASSSGMVYRKLRSSIRDNSLIQLYSAL